MTIFEKFIHTLLTRLQLEHQFVKTNKMQYNVEVCKVKYYEANEISKLKC